MKINRSLTSAFILFHILAIVVWASPYRATPIDDLRELFRPYMIWSGLFQSWDTFAPNPKAENVEIKAMLVTEDRHLRTWLFPRMQDLTISQRYSKERYRKFEEVISAPTSAAAWPDVARHLTSLVGNRSDAQEKVILILFTTEMKPWIEDPPDGAKSSRIFFSDFVSVGGA